MSIGLIKPSKNVIIDTIPLLLFLVGNYDVKLLSTFKKIKTYRYTEKDFRIFRQYLAYAETITVTPGVLSEVSNFAAQLKQDKFRAMLKKNIEILENAEEVYISKRSIIESDEIFKFGFTDTSLILAAKDHGGQILTRDYKLCQYCQSLGISARNIEEILEVGELFK